MKMPKRGSRIDLFPNIADARDGRVQQGELFDLGGKLRGITIGYHHPDVVTDEIDIFVPKTLNQLMDIDGCSFLVIAGSFSRRLAQAAQIRSNYCARQQALCVGELIERQILGVVDVKDEQT